MIATAFAAESGRGRVFGTLGLRIAEKAEGAPKPSRSRWRVKERKPASWRIRERLCTPAPRRAAMKARDVQRLQPHEVADRRRLAEMDGQEGQELAQIPGVGLDRLRRQPALAGEPRQPRGGLATRVGRAGQDGLGCVRRDGLGPT